jgi:BlaI family transcriptional regulator, penicillinase repressor
VKVFEFVENAVTVNRAKKLPPLSDAQMEVMQEVWSRNEATVTEVWQAVSSKRTVARNTILTMMDRLERKGWLSKRAVANAHLYKATVTQKKTLGQVVRDLTKSTFEGAAGQMIVAMLESSELTAEELDSIAAIIEAKKKSN